MTGGSRNPVKGDTYIRQLPYSAIKHLSILLDIDKQWERLVVKIPKRLQDVGQANTEMRYSYHQVRLFEDKGKRADGSPTKSIIDDWATQNAKVKHLIQVLQEAALYEAADYLSVNVLHGEKVPRLHDQQSSSNDNLPEPDWSDKKKTVSSSPPCKEKVFSENFDNNCEKERMCRPEKLVNRPNDQQYGKAVLCERDLCNGAACQKEPGYNRLLMPNKDQAYNKLGPSGNGENYYRVPSFDSGDLSDVLKAGNQAGNQYMELSGGVENDEETYELRSIKNVTAVKKLDDGTYSYAYADSPGVYQFAKEVPNKDGKTMTEPPYKNVQQNATLDNTPYRNFPQQAVRVPCETSDTSETEQDGSDDQYKLLGNQRMTYELLRAVTDNFNEKSLRVGGRVIGSGGFGDVFLGIMNNGFKIAVKRLKKLDENVDKQFETELASLVKYRHKNIVRLYGFSIDGPGKCLVYEYLSNGSLEDRLLRKDNTPSLPVAVRLNILKGTAQGIDFLNSQGIVHRDIKSANVLLDDNFEPKVGDFATARAGPHGNTTIPMSTQLVIGTKAYLAPEAMNFDVSTKLDSYSFGIIVLEVLTALPPFDDSREEKDLKSHVEESKYLDILDVSGGHWSEETVSRLIKISDQCTELKKKLRVNVADILPELMSL